MLDTWPAYRRAAVTPAGYRYDCPGVYVRENGSGEEEFHPHRFEYGEIVWERLARLGLDPDGRLLPASAGGRDLMLAIARLTQANGRPPTLRELVATTRITSTSVVHKRLEALRTAGWVDWEEEQCRTLHLTTDVVLDPAGGPGHVERAGEVVAGARPVAATCPTCATPNSIPVPMPEPGVYQCRYCAGRTPVEAWEVVPV